MANTDDPSIPASSLRAWVMGMCEPPTSTTDTNVRPRPCFGRLALWIEPVFFLSLSLRRHIGLRRGTDIIAAGSRMGCGAYFMLSARALIDLACKQVVPNWSIFGVSLNPGPFTVKEHVLLSIMATVGAGCLSVVLFHSGKF